jgi:hypothetical protein
MTQGSLSRRCALLAYLAAVGCGAANASAPAPVSAPPAPKAITLQFSQLFATGAELRASDLAQQLSGQRVRMVGFMAELEAALAPRGAFYLTPRPVSCDEAGGGTADLPIESVLVSVPFMRDRTLPHIHGALEVTGTFEAGNRVDASGYASSFRIQLDDAPKPFSGPHSGS